MFSWCYNSSVAPDIKVITKVKQASLGVVRLDYDYPHNPGDVDSPLSYDYQVLYRAVPGLTFDMCKSGKLTPEVEKQLMDAVDWLVEQGVSGITSDCGFMMYYQDMVRKRSHLPVFMSSLAILPAVTTAFSSDEKIAIFTASGDSLTPMKDIIKKECGVDPSEERFVIVACDTIPGFEAVAKGEKVDAKKVGPGIVAKAKEVLASDKAIRALMMECTELPQFSDELRKETKLPVFDAINAANMLMAGFQDNVRFGLNEWQEAWDGTQYAYEFGKNLTEEQKAALVNK
jgi:Asp/Glu/hydantoin racemase